MDCASKHKEIILKKAETSLRMEYESEFAFLRGRKDCLKEFEYFLHVLSLGIQPGALREKYSRPLAGLNCVQVPLEIFDALGFHPFRMRFASPSVHGIVSDLPPSACPAIKSCLGHFCSHGSPENSCELAVIPSTCDWNVKFPELAEGKADRVYLMELPHVKETEKGRKRWLEEIYALKEMLEKKSGRKLSRHLLRESIGSYAEAWETFGKLIEARRGRRLSAVWFLVIANAFLIDNVKAWTGKTEAALNALYSVPPDVSFPGIFLSGSPVSFPNLKMIRLLEDAGIYVLADEMCSSERILVGAPVFEDASEHGLLRALAEKYQLACHCPTFAGNGRRIEKILETMRVHNIKGLVYHLLKGCHPYDIESSRVEKAVRKNGFHFIKIETDYSQEDGKQILVRLEAFRELLEQ